jgi:hypothetical protein
MRQRPIHADVTKAMKAGRAGTQSAAAAAVRCLAIAWRLASVYDLEHPRVAGAMAAAVERLLALRTEHNGCILHVRGAELCLGAEVLPAEDALEWLRQRLERCGMRAIELLANASVEHLRELLERAREAGRGDPRALVEQWRPDHPGVRLLPMVFDGSFGGDGEASAVPDMAPGPRGSGRGGKGSGNSAGSGSDKGVGASLPEHIGSALGAMLTDAEVTERLRTIETLAANDAERGSSRVNVLQQIGSLLPADVSRDPSAIEKVVKQILARIENDLQEMVRTGAAVRGGALMRQALVVARRFFRTVEAPARPETNLPTGRPQDDAITADVGLLRAEMAKLPPTAFVQLPPAVALARDAKGPARELFGIALHTLWHGQSKHRFEVLPPLLGALLRTHGDDLADIVARYLGQQGRGQDGPRRVLLQCLCASGPAAAAIARHYLDAPLLAATFPELLPLFCRSLGDDDKGLQVLRDGLARVQPLLALGARAGCERSGVLKDPAVVRVLLSIGGPVGDELLPLAACQADRPVQELLVAWLQQQPLPAAEAAVLGGGLPALPNGYLERVIAAWLAKRPFESLRGQTSAALRQAVERRQAAGDPVALLRAIDDLRLCPDDETKALLTRLCKAGRFTRLDGWSRTVRKQAAAVLKHLTSKEKP